MSIPIPLQRALKTEADMMSALHDGAVSTETLLRFVRQVLDMEAGYRKQIEVMQISLQHCDRLRKLIVAITGQVEAELFPSPAPGGLAADEATPTGGGTMMAPPAPSAEEQAVLDQMEAYRVAGKCDHIERMSLGAKAVCGKKATAGTGRCKAHQ